MRLCIGQLFEFPELMKNRDRKAFYLLTYTVYAWTKKRKKYIYTCIYNYINIYAYSINNNKNK